MLGYSISNIVNLNGIQQVSLGGKISGAGKYFMNDFKKSLKNNLMEPRIQKCEVFISK